MLPACAAIFSSSSYIRIILVSLFFYLNEKTLIKMKRGREEERERGEGERGRGGRERGREVEDEGEVVIHNSINQQ